MQKTGPFATSLGRSLCTLHRASTQQTHSPRRMGLRHVRAALVTLLVEILQALHLSEEVPSDNGRGRGRGMTKGVAMFARS